MSTQVIQMIPYAERRLRDTTTRLVLLGGQKLSQSFANSVTAMDIEFTIEAASNVTITVRDHDRRWLRSGVFNAGLILSIIDPVDGVAHRFSLSSVSKTGDDLSLVFEDEAIWKLRRITGTKKIARGVVTRAEFVYILTKEVKPPVQFYSPEIYVPQKVASETKAVKREIDPPLSDRTFSFAKNAAVKIKGVRADAEQIANLEKILDEGVRLHASRVVLIAAAAAATTESNCRNLAGGDRDSVGVFQQRPSAGWTGLRNVTKAARQFYMGPSEQGPHGCIYIYRDNPDHQPYWYAAEVQRSYDWKANSNLSGKESYGKWTTEARNNVNIYLGRYSRKYRGDVDRESKKRSQIYEFMRGNPTDPDNPESSWDAIRRLADEVKWYAFVYKNVLHFISGSELIGRESFGTINEFDTGIFDIDFNWDSKNPLPSEVTLNVAAERWQFPPGGVVVLDGCGPADGRWLISNMKRSMFSQVMDVTLRKADRPLLEPAPETQLDAINMDTGKLLDPTKKIINMRTALVKMAENGLTFAGIVRYSMDNRSGEDWRDRKVHYYDCSSWVHTCFKLSGLPDPIGKGYREFPTWTGPLSGCGKKVANPTPGDLAFYGKPTQSGAAAHVTIYVGNGMEIGMGKPTKTKTKGARSDFAYYVSPGIFR